MAAGSASAANSLNAGSVALNVGMDRVTPLIAGKYSISKDMAILGGLGFQSAGPNGRKETTLALLAGVRKYLKTDDFAPFVGGVFQYSTTSGTPSSSTTSLLAEFGAEYFLAKQFSIEGKARFGFGSEDNAGAKTSTFGTSTAGVGVNYYF